MRYLEKVSGTYRVRLRIPKDIKKYFGQAEIRKSLHTSRFGQAKVLLYNLLSETERIFTMIRAGVLSDDMIRKIVADYLDKSIDSFERQRRGEGNEYVKAYDAEFSNVIASDFGHDMLCKGMGFLNDYKRKALAKRKAQDIDGIMEAALHYIKQHKLDIVPESAEFDRLCHELLKADIQAEGVVLEHVQGNYETDYDRDLKERKKVKTLKELIDIYQKEKEGGWADPASTKAIHSKILHMFGNIRLSQIDREMCIAFREDLKEYPLKNEDFDAPWRELAKKKKSRLAPRTQNGTVIELITLFDYALNNAMGIQGNPAKGLAKSKDDCEKVKNREAFTIEELNNLVKLLTEVDRSTNTETFWIPLLLLYTGARSNEICMLRCADIENGFIHFRNKPEYYQRTKNKKDRKVPIHSQLLKLGLSEFIDSQKLAGNDRLFHNLRVSKGGKWNVDYGKQFNRTFKLKFLAGYSKEQLGKKDLHSIRKTFITWFTDSKLVQTPADFVTLQSIVGHTDTEEMKIFSDFMQKVSLTVDGYGGGLTVDPNALLEKLYYGLDLAPLSIHTS